MEREVINNFRIWYGILHYTYLFPPHFCLLFNIVIINAVSAFFDENDTGYHLNWFIIFHLKSMKSSFHFF